MTHKGNANILTDKYLERRYESDFMSSEIQFIDLGLPSGTLWADRNIGADAPEDYGEYFRWGETTTFMEDSYNYDYSDLGDNIAGTKYDVATTILGKGYMMPTYEQLNELLHSCTWERTTINGVYGMKVTGLNGNSIFLPAAGFYYNISRELAGKFAGKLAAVGSGGYYWTAMHGKLYGKKYSGIFLDFNSHFCTWALFDLGGGLTIRPVKTSKKSTL